LHDALMHFRACSGLFSHALPGSSGMPIPQTL
jgi:hypothetical protein